MDFDAGLEIRGAGGGGGGGKDGGGGGGGQSRNPVEAPNNLFSVAFAKTLLAVSEGEIEGFPSGVPAKDIYLDGTQIQRNDGGLNFQGVTIEYRSGTDSQIPIPGFSQVENTVNVSTQVTQNVGPVTRTISDPDIERVRVIIQHPSLQSVDTGTGDTNPTSVAYRIAVSSNGGPFVTQAEPTISGKSSGQFQRAYEFALPAGGAPWQVRVTRLTADSTSGFLSNSIVWQAYTEIVDEKFAYPNTALLGVRVDARQFNNIPDVTIKLRGKRVQIPANYDPTTRTYTGFWDGSWKTAWTDNPAWIFRDLVLNPIYGVRRYLPQISIDPFYLYTVSQYCDELVPNGLGGQEPRFRCNLFLQNTGSVFEVLNSLASVFRGLLYYEGGKLYVTQDRPGVPVQQFSEANVIQEVDDRGIVTSPCFSYAGSSRTARKSVVLANWDDPEQRFNSVVEYQQDDELLTRFGYNPIDLRLIGVTSRGQALRAAKFALFTNRYETEKVSFRVAAEGLAAGIGEIIQIADPGKQGQRIAGRIKAISGNTITTDATLTLQGGVSYTVTLVVPDGETSTNPDGTTFTRPALKVHNVLSSSTSSEGLTKLTLDGTVTAQTSSLWVLEWQDLSASLYRILSVSETEPLRYLIEAIQYNESKYAYIDNSLPIAVPKDRYVVRDVQPPTGVSAKLDFRNNRVRIFANWVAPQLNGIDDPQVLEYRYQYRMKGAEQWIDSPGTSYTEADISLFQFTYGMQFQFRVASRNRLGQQSNWLQVDVANFEALPDISVPAYAASVSHVNQPDGSQLIIINSGKAPLPERVAGYRIWAKPGSDLVGMIPGVKMPEADGYYRINDVPLTGYYAISFHAPATYTVRVAFLSAVPGEEAGTSYIFNTVARAEIVPPTPTQFTVVQSQGNSGKRFSWTLPVPSFGAWDKGIVTDIMNYQVRYKQGALGSLTPSQAWDVALPLFSGGVPATQQWFETTLFDNDSWTVLLKAVDQTGWSSDNPAYILVNTQQPLASNVVVTGTANWSAATTELVNCSTTAVYGLGLESGGALLAESGTKLVLDQAGATYIRQADISTDAYVTWIFDNNDVDSSLLLTTSANATYQHYIRSLSDLGLPLLMESGSSLLLESGNRLLTEAYDYSAISMLSMASTVWHPYAPMELLTDDLYAVRTRFRSSDGTTLGEVNSVTYELDYKDILETFNDVATSAGADTTVMLTKPFYAVTGVQATLQANGGTAVSVVIISKSTTQVVLKTINSSGTRVAGLVDLTVQGY